MRVAVVLGTLDLISAWHISKMQYDRVYHFSVGDIQIPNYPSELVQVSNPQVDPLEEMRMVNRCIERNLSPLARSFLNDVLVVRALRLSEVRFEARSLLNFSNFIEGAEFSDVGSGGVCIYTRYLIDKDIKCDYFHRFKWECLPAFRFFGLIPKFGSLLLIFAKWRARFSVR